MKEVLSYTGTSGKPSYFAFSAIGKVRVLKVISVHGRDLPLNRTVCLCTPYCKMAYNHCYCSHTYLVRLPPQHLSTLLKVVLNEKGGE